MISLRYDYDRLLVTDYERFTKLFTIVLLNHAFHKNYVMLQETDILIIVPRKKRLFEFIEFGDNYA